MKKINVAEPMLDGNEQKYVMDCLETGWISGSGKYVGAFEEQFADFCGTKYAVAVSNGTVALHVALLALGIGPGDEVIVPDFTYIASANSVTYCGATPILVDVDPETLALDSDDVERKITPRTKAIMPVHIYGHPANMDPIQAIAARHNLYVIEDAAEAHGAEYKGRRVGGIGDVATFSFYGNKIITTGEGGMVTTNDEALAKEIQLLKGQGMDPNRRYWFPMVGYNYRMTNLQAAIGLAQFERISYFIERRIEVASWYAEQLKDTDMVLPGQADWAKNVFWLYSPMAPKNINRDKLIVQMAEQGVETRPFFYPMHVLPPYFDPKGDSKYPVTTSAAARGLNLPSSSTLSREDVKYISDALKSCIEEQNGRNPN